MLKGLSQEREGGGGAQKRFLKVRQRSFVVPGQGHTHESEWLE